MVTRTLPATDEAILASLKNVAKGIPSANEWCSGDTIINNLIFGAFVRHANQNWFAVEEKGFVYSDDDTTVSMFIKQLREREAKLVQA